MSQIKSLPTIYTAHQVVGITEGGGLRPSIYFSDGAHFTQSHKMKTNIGFHPPPALGHTFFGNVESSDLDHEWHKIINDPTIHSNIAQDMAFSDYLKTFSGKGNQNPVVRRASGGVNTTGKVLVEVMDTGRGLITHESRSPLKAVTISKAYQLLAEVRSRSENIGGPDPVKKEYFFL